VRAPRSPGTPEGSCVFCQIARGQSEAALVLEDEQCVAFLDHRPLFPGHSLLLPRAHCATLGELAPELVAPLFARVQRLARAVERALAAEGSFIAINNRVSQSVPHLHVHVVPRRRGDGLRGFFWPRAQYTSAEEAQRVQAAIRAALADLDASGSR
jgi:histidine triad (HIT) family protein